ncbi:uncharacterized protein LOC131952917 [Physella acuta]|uniref:uncharacterized protein LOC131952917 n=1 Tax=Physella acuta TaxID=109671 RepID=UPI0027DC45A8|nr:uncharacterized protein LOC131952917 [Physella acuta]
MAPVLLIFLLYITTICFVTEALFNAALYKPAYMSSVYVGTAYKPSADRANDGNLDAIFSHGSCAHSSVNNPGWWMVDLNGLYSVEQIVLVNRGDQYNASATTKNFQFDVFETDPRSSPGFPMESGQVCYARVDPVGQGEKFIQNCTSPILGRFVRYIRFTNDALSFCEVQVLASYTTYVMNNFSSRKNSILQVTPVSTTYTISDVACTLLCLQRRDSDTCTAVNWVRTTKQCQMLKVDPRSIPALTPNSDTDFYIEAN